MAGACLADQRHFFPTKVGDSVFHHCGTWESEGKAIHLITIYEERREREQMVENYLTSLSFLKSIFENVAEGNKY